MQQQQQHIPGEQQTLEPAAEVCHFAALLFPLPFLQVGAYKYLSGTSMAVPHVTGAIARVWAVYPNCPASTVRAAFEQTAKDLGPKGKDVQFGHGLVQAEAAFDYLARQPCAKGQAAGALDADERTQLGQ
jgi:subtilisin family serine protease